MRAPYTTILQTEYKDLIKFCADLDIALVGGNPDRIKETATQLVEHIEQVFDRKSEAEVKRAIWKDRRTPKKPRL